MCLANSPLQAIAEFDEFDDAINENEEDEEVDIAQLRSELTEIYRAKWLVDNCKSITKMIERLHQEADRLATLRAEGWKLEDEIIDDYGLLVPPDLEEKVAAALRERAVPH